MDKELWPPDTFRAWAKNKANPEQLKRLLWRIQGPSEEPLVVGLDVDADLREDPIRRRGVRRRPRLLLSFVRAAASAVSEAE